MYKGTGRASGSGGSGRGHTVPVRLLADCRVIAGAGPLSSSPAAITIAAAARLPGLCVSLRQAIFAVFSLFTFSYFQEVFAKDLLSHLSFSRRPRIAHLPAHTLTSSNYPLAAQPTQ